MAKRYIDRRTGKEVVMANLSRRHPDWGVHPLVHVARKAERQAGLRPISKMGFA